MSAWISEFQLRYSWFLVLTLLLTGCDSSGTLYVNDDDAASTDTTDDAASTDDNIDEYVGEGEITSVVLSLNLPEAPEDAVGVARIRTNLGAFPGTDHIPGDQLGFQVGNNILVVDGFTAASLETSSLIYHWENVNSTVLTDPVTVTPPFNHAVALSHGRKAHFDLRVPSGT